MVASPFVSVIIPVYNSEKTLVRCLDSILSQSFHDFEVVIIDDGSIDSFGKICDSYAVRDLRLRVVHKENEGVSMARKTGFEVSKDQYCINVDSDNWVDSDYLRFLVEKAEEDGSDMVICDYHTLFSPDRHEIYKHDMDKVQDMDEIRMSFLMDRIQGFLWNKLIQLSLLRKENCFAPIKLSMREDKFLVGTLLASDVRVSFLPRPLNFYDLYSNSQSLSSIIYMDQVLSMEFCIRFLEELFSDERFVEGICEMKSHCLYRALYADGIEHDKLLPEFHEKYLSRLRGVPKLYFMMRINGCVHVANMFWHSNISLKKHIRMSA